MSKDNMRNASRFTKNLGDDVAAEGSVLHMEDGNAYAMIKTPPDENFLPIVPWGHQEISGHGDVTNEDCGDFKSAYHNKLDHVRIKRFTCHLQGCPKCFRIWARRIAASAAGYLWAFVEGDKERGIAKHTIAHWTLSPPNDFDPGEVPDDKKDEYAEGMYKMLMGKLRAIINRFGKWENTVLSVITHPRRKRCPKCRSAIPDNKSFCIPCNQPAEWYFSPHLHVNTSFHYRFEDVSNFVQYEAENQVIFNQIAIVPTKDDLENIIAYELGHALYIPGEQHQAIRYYGLSAKTHFRSEITKVKEEVGETDKLDPNLQHIYYKIEDQLCDEIEPGILRITKFNGGISYAKTLSGDRIPLTRTRYVYRLMPLGRWINGRWTRTAVPRKVPKQKDTRTPWDTIGWENRFLNV